MLERMRSFVSDNRVVARIRSVMLGPYYPIPFCFLAFLGYCIRYEVIIIVLFALAACVGLVICADLRPLMPPLLTIVYIVNIYQSKTSNNDGGENEVTVIPRDWNI